ncbi:uncharacterized transmembrane protein DDB_G0281039-like [Anopheles maculipalpis]|uniref:uncharacterized transmembrane protein DDB_G0281039-like n=1 Tax=Anopheles maculipalpis TaxID=1496333 RepID=UPI002159B3B3|nr:uncharacterized transmembrane protein DDB_G0281039-like [Anopheles maculipalpis]
MPPPSPPLSLTAVTPQAATDGSGDSSPIAHPHNHHHLHQHQQHHHLSHQSLAASPIFSHPRAARQQQYPEQLYPHHQYHRHQYPTHQQHQLQQSQHQQQQQQQQQQQYHQQLAFSTSFTSVTPPDLELAGDVVLHGGSNATSPTSAAMTALFVVKGQLAAHEYGTVGRG